MVASPRPRHIIEADAIGALARTGAVVIAGGGGGIAVVRDGQGWRAVDAVIDKDRASALLASRIGLSTLVLVTGVDQVYVGFGTDRQRALDEIDQDEARSHLVAGEFPAGSMGPKVDSALDFLAAGGDEVVITSIAALPDALERRAGTRITRSPHAPERTAPDRTPPPKERS